MNLQTIENIIALSHKRIPYLIEHGDGDFYKGSETYIKGILNEIQEMQVENKEKNHVHLEDELGDIFWDYICLLESLEQEGKIVASRVFDRCYAKFSERLNPDGSNHGDWYEVKKLQKEKLKTEHETMFPTL